MFRKYSEFGMAVSSILAAIGTFIAGSCIAFFVLFGSLLFSAVCGYILGFILKLFFGNIICTGLGFIFNTTRFVPSMIPYMSSVLMVISNFFKPNINVNKGD